MAMPNLTPEEINEINSKVQFNIQGITLPLLEGVIWAGYGLAVVFTIVRTCIRFRVSRRLFLDDYWMYFALILFTSMAIMYQLCLRTIIIVDLVTAKKYIPGPSFFPDTVFYLKLQHVIILFFWSSLWCVKASFLSYYKKLFTGLPHLIIWWYIVTGFTTLAYIGCVLFSFLSCQPFKGIFEVQGCNTPADIWRGNFSLYYATATDIFCDLLIMALPLRLLWGLQINAGEKRGLLAIFSIGFIIIAFAIVRVVFTSATTKHVDPLWLALWTMVENAISIIVGNLPAFRYFVSSRRTRADDSYPSYGSSTKKPGVLSWLSGGRKSNPSNNLSYGSATASNANARRFNQTRGAIRLDNVLYSDTGAAKDIGLPMGDPGTKYSATATHSQVRPKGDNESGESTEGILERGMAEEVHRQAYGGVHVRNDVYMSSETV